MFTLAQSHQRGMTMAPSWDGYLVQRTPSETLEYRGAACMEVWPLAFVESAEASQLTNEVQKQFYEYDDRGRYRLWVVRSMDLAIRYSHACRATNIDVRILGCAETDSAVSAGEYNVLGWDIASSSFSSSLIELELFSDDAKLRPFRQMLNENGLFRSLEDLMAYLSFRQSLVDAGENLEHAEEMRRIFVGEFSVV
jgi:hypothetical protein